MNVLKLIFKPETRLPVVAMAFASTVSVGLVVARILWTSNYRYTFLIWNLFLAWLPLVFAMLARQNFRVSERPGWRCLGFAATWLLFFPNAPYIFTDLTHVNNPYHPNFWVDLGIILPCAFTGLVIGFVSLYLMHSVAIRMYGRVVGWAFVLGVAGLSSFGIYLGRFLRLNSWDLVANPAKLYHGIASFATASTQPRHFIFLGLFATFLFIAYLMLYALTHLPAAIQTVGAAPDRETPAVA